MFENTKGAIKKCVHDAHLLMFLHHYLKNRTMMKILYFMLITLLSYDTCKVSTDSIKNITNQPFLSISPKKNKRAVVVDNNFNVFTSFCPDVLGVL